MVLNWGADHQLVSDTRVWGHPLLQRGEFYRLVSGRSISAVWGEGGGDFQELGPAHFWV